MEHTKISLFKTKGNLNTLRKGLDSLIRKIENKEIVINLQTKVQLSLLYRQITIGIYDSPIFQIQHITYFYIMRIPQILFNNELLNLQINKSQC